VFPLKSQGEIGQNPTGLAENLDSMRSETAHSPMGGSWVQVTLTISRKHVGVKQQPPPHRSPQFGGYLKVLD